MLGIRLKNLWGHADTRVTFESPLSILIGKNEAGKTSLFNGLMWCLYEDTPEHLSLQDLIKWGCDDMSVTVNLDNGYTIERSRVPGKTTLTVLTSVGDEIEGSMAQECINRLMGVSKNTFMFSYFLGAPKVKEFINSTSSDRLKVAQEIASLLFWEKAFGIAHGHLEKTRSNMERLSAEAKYLQSTIQSNEAELESLRQQHGNLVEERDKKIQEKEATLSILNSKLNWAKLNQKVLSQDLKKDRRLLEEEETTIKIAIEKASGEFIRLSAIRERDVCFQCGQHIKDSTKKNYQELCTILAKDIAENRGKLVEWGSRYQLIKEAIAKAEKEEEWIRQATIQAHNLKYELENLQSTRNPFDEVVEAKKRTLEDARRNVEIVQASFVSNNIDFKNLTFLDNAFSKGGIPNMLLDSLRWFLQDRANLYAKYYTGNRFYIEFPTTAIRSGKERGDKFEILLHIGERVVPYESFSKGARNRLNTAMSFAILDWLQLKNATSNYSFLLADEIFDALDTEGIEMTVGLLKWKAGIASPEWEGLCRDVFGSPFSTTPIKNIITVSHNLEMLKYFDNIFVVEKDGQNSTISSIRPRN
jgi:DNA repair exonuclease SbcCD ATPase subunit